MRSLEPVCGSFGKHGTAERAKRLAPLDSLVDQVRHIGSPGIGQERTVPERSRPPFGTALEPTDNLSSLEPFGSSLDELALVIDGAVLKPGAAERGHLVTDDWSKYSGFDHVVVRTDELSAEDVGRALARVRRRVYFSPRFIKNRLGYIRNVRDVAALARKAWRLVSSHAFDRAS